MKTSFPVREYEPLYPYCAYRTGGQSRYFVMPEKVDDLKNAIIWANALKLPHEVIGHGTNLLISDEGYEGVVICLREFEKWCVRKGSAIYAGAGAQLNEVVRYTCEEGLKGLENLAGIPGTLGGAVRMNAGAFGTEIKDSVRRINVLAATENGLKEKLLYHDEAQFGYRRSDGLSGKIVLAAEFELAPSSSLELRTIRSDIIKRRADKQPLQYPSCGSVFKRPAGAYAGELIERCGLKGYAIGGAQISEKHANFIINTGKATSSDIFKLIQLAKMTVLKNTGIMLEEEVRYLGRFF